MGKRLYYEDPYCKSMTARVLSCREAEGGYDVALDRTCFYPEGGGQPWDTGLLGGVRVLSVREEDGEVIHRLESPLAVGDQVEGTIDWERRFDLMQQHSGEHILSGLLCRRFGYRNVGFHIGMEEMTVDFSGPLTMDQGKELEREANRVVCQNAPIRAFFPDPGELDALEYRSKKELSGPVRIVEIPGADVCACCGTHVARTGEVGLIKITSLIHYKGGVRMTMVCGLRALRDYQDKQDQVIRVSNLLSAKTGEISAAVEKLKEESGARAFLAGRLYRELFAAWTREYPEQEGRLLVWKEDLSPVQLREFCDLLSKGKKGSAVLVCSGGGECFQYALGSQSEDMRALARELNGKLNGRGGGSASMAQGTFRASRKSIEAAFLEE